MLHQLRALTYMHLVCVTTVCLQLHSDASMNVAYSATIRHISTSTVGAASASGTRLGIARHARSKHIMCALPGVVCIRKADIVCANAPSFAPWCITSLVVRRASVCSLVWFLAIDHHHSCEDGFPSSNVSGCRAIHCGGQGS